MTKSTDAPISDLVSTVIDYRGKTPKKSDTGIPLITAKVIKDGRITNTRAEFIPTDSYSSWMRRGLPEVGDIVVTTEAPLGEVAQITTTQRVALAQRVILLRPDRAQIEPQFLFHFLRSPEARARMRQRSSGTTVSGIRQPELLAVRVPLLDRSQQAAAAAFLDALDELISINERRIELLEDLARSLYRTCFVHRAAPADWQRTTVGEVCDIVRGRSYKRTELSEVDGVPFLNLKCVARGGGFRPDGLKRYTGRFKDAQRAVAGETLVAVTDMSQERRIVGQAFRMPLLDAEFAVPSLDLALLRPHDERDRSFIYASLRYSGFSERVRHYANGANVLHLAVERIAEAPIVMPDRETIDQITALLDPLLDRAEACNDENRRLASARDLLLPRLVSGRLDISDIDLGDLLPNEAAA
jgi:type I restriction enzyme S subunit